MYFWSGIIMQRLKTWTIQWQSSPVHKDAIIILHKTRPDIIKTSHFFWVMQFCSFSKCHNLIIRSISNHGWPGFREGCNWPGQKLITAKTRMPLTLPELKLIGKFNYTLLLQFLPSSYIFKVTFCEQLSCTASKRLEAGTCMYIRIKEIQRILILL